MPDPSCPINLGNYFQDLQDFRRRRGVVLVHCSIVAAGGFLLARLAEVADAFEVADDAGHVVDVLRMAVGALLEVALVDMAAVVADGVGNVEGEVVAAFLGGHLEQLQVLLLREVFLEVAVECRATGEVLDVVLAVEAELVEHGERLVLDDIEVGVVAVARHEVAVLAVPFGVLDADVLGGDHLAVEHHLLGAVFFVLLLHQAEDGLYELAVFGAVLDGDAHEFRGLDEAVDADGEVLACDVDIAGIEERQHAVALELLEVLVVGQLHLMAEVDDVGEELLIVLAVLDGILDAAVEVDGEHRLGARGDAAGTQRVAEAVVGDLVAQAAAGTQGVGIVGDVGEEGVAFGVHLGGEVGHILVDELAVFVVEQRHGLDREGQHGLGALLVEPFHEALLQPAEAVPVGLAAVGEAELAEEALEIGLVVVGHVPEHRLVVAGAGGLVQRVDDLLEAVGDDLVHGLLPQREVDDLVGLLPVVLSVVLLDEVVEVHEELGGGAGAAQHGGDHEDHVDEAAAVGLEVGGSRGVAADAGGAAEEPRVHSDGGAVVGQRRLVVLVDEVVRQQVDIAVAHLFAVHLLDTVGEEAAVEADEAALRQLADEGGDIFVLHVGVGVELGTRGGIGGHHIVAQEAQLLHRLAVLGMLLAVEDEALGHVVVALLHQGYLHLVLYLLDGDAVMDVDAGKNLRQAAQVDGLVLRVERLDDGIHDFVQREAFLRAVAFGDGETVGLHCLSVLL